MTVDSELLIRMLAILFILLGSTNAFDIAIPKTSKRVVKLEKYGNCPGTDLPIRFTKTKISRLDRYTFAVNGEVEQTLTNLGEPFVIATVYKCRSVAEENSCEYYMKIEAKDVCKKLQEDNQAWSSIVKSFTPRILCPIKAGTYSHTNSTIKSEELDKLVLDGDVWSFKLEGFFKEQPIFCLAGLAQILKMKKN